MVDKRIWVVALAIASLSMLTGGLPLLAQGAANPATEGAGPEAQSLLGGPGPSAPATTGTNGIFVAGPNPTPAFDGTTISFDGRIEGELIDVQYSASNVTFTQDDGGRPQIDNKSFLFAFESSSGSGVLTGSQDGGAPFVTVAGLVAEFDPPVSKAGAFMSDTAPLGNYTVEVFDTNGGLLDTITLAAADFPTISGYPNPDASCDQSFPWDGTGCGVWVGFEFDTAIIGKIQFGPSDASGDSFAIDDLVFSGDEAPAPEGLVYQIVSLPALGTIQGITGPCSLASPCNLVGSKLIYEPGEGEKGTDSFEYQIFDKRTLLTSAIALVSINISDFILAGNNLRVNLVGNGEVTLDVNNSVVAFCTTSPCDNAFGDNVLVKLQARPLNTSTFVNYTGNCSGTSQIFILDMGTSDKECTATFSP